MTIKNIIITLIAVMTIFPCNGQSNVTNKTLMIHLKAGENTPVKFEKLLIERIHLIIQPESKPWEVRVQVVLNFTFGNRTYNTALQYYKTDNGAETTYPIVFGEYIFDLKIDGDNVALIVERSDFGKEFRMDFREKAVIGELIVSFVECIGESIALPTGGSADLNARYTILVSDGHEEQELSFDALSWLKKDELVLEWKEYQIFVLQTATQDYLKLKINKIVNE